MRWGIDIYSFHRYFGEVYPVQKPAEYQWDCLDLVRELLSLGIDGLSIESCFLSGPEDPKYREIHTECRKHEAEMILAWGHPFGLYGGTDEKALQDMLSYLPLCSSLGVGTMRIVGSNRRLMASIPKDQQLSGVKRCLKEASLHAEEHQVLLAIENHQDFLCRELLEILEEIDSPWLGVNYDSGNSMRLGEDPLDAARTLGSWIKAVHLKDVDINPEAEEDSWIHWSCVPVGKGAVDIPGLIGEVEKTGFSGVYAVELDMMHPHYPDEMEVLKESLTYLSSMVLS